MAKIIGNTTSMPNPRPDWNQNDETKADYVKNRTHWKEEVEVDYLALSYIEPIPELGLGAYGKKIGLEVGKTYTVDFEVQNGQVVTLSGTATELPKEVFGITVPGVVFLYIPEGGLQILDGVDGDVTKGEIYIADNCYYTFNQDVSKITIHGLTGKNIVVHKIPKEYLPPVDIPEDFIEPEMLKDASVTEEKIKDGSVTAKKLEQPVLLETVSFDNNAVEYIEFTPTLFANSKYRKFKIVGRIEAGSSNSDHLVLLDNRGSVVGYIPLDFTVVNNKYYYIDLLFDYTKDAFGKRTDVEAQIQNDSYMSIYGFKSAHQFVTTFKSDFKSPLKLGLAHTEELWFLPDSINGANLHLIGLETIS